MVTSMHRKSRIICICAAFIVICAEEFYVPSDWNQFYLHVFTWLLLVCAVSRRIRIDLVSGSVLLGCFAPIGIASIFCVFVYTPLYYAAKTAVSRRDVIATGILVAIVYGYCLTGWATSGLEHSSLVSVGLTMYCCLVTVPMLAGLHAILTCQFTKLFPLSILVIPVTESIRLHMPFPLPYHLTASTTASCTYLSQLIELLDFSGVAVLISAMSYFGLQAITSVYVAYGTSFSRSCRVHVTGLSLLLTLLSLYGFFRCSAHQTMAESELVAIVAQEFNPKRFELRAVDRATELLRAIELALEKVDFNSKTEKSGTILFLPEGALSTAYVDEKGWMHTPLNVLTPSQLANVRELSQKAIPVVAGITIPISQSRSRYAVAVLQPPNYEINETFVRDKLRAAPIGESVPFATIPILQKLGALVSESNIVHEIRDPTAFLNVSIDQQFAVSICYEHVFPDVWTSRGLSRGVHVQSAFGSMRWFNYSQIERSQSRAVRQLLAIRERRPFLYVTSGGSEWIDIFGKIREELGPKERFGIFRMHLPKHAESNELGISAAARTRNQCICVIACLIIAMGYRWLG